MKNARERRAGLKLQGIAAFGVVDRLLQILSFFDLEHATGRGRIREGCLQILSGKLGRAIELCRRLLVSNFARHQ
jgi:hypothetical protein